MTDRTPGAGPVSATAEGREVLARLERQPFTRVHLRVTAILGIGTFFDSFDAVILGVALTAVLSTLGAPLSVGGALLAAGYVGQLIGGVVFGVVSERFGRKPAFVASTALFGVLSVAAAFAGSVSELMAWRVLQGIGLGAEVPVAAAMVNEFVRARARGRTVMVYESLFTWGILVASLVGAMVLALMPPERAWRTLFLLGGIPVLAAAWACWRLPESPRYLAHRGRVDRAAAVVAAIERSRPVWPGAGRGAAVDRIDAPEPDRTPTRLRELLAPTFRRRTAVLWTTWFTSYFAAWGLTTWTPALLVSVGGLTPAGAALGSGAVVVAGMVAVYVAAATIDRVGRRTWFVAGYGLALAGGVYGVVAIGVLGLTSWAVLLTALGTVLVGVNVNAPLLYMYTAELYPTRMRGWATSVGAGLRTVAAIAAPLALGGLVVAGADGLVRGLLLVGAVLLVGLVVFARYGPETAGRSLEELSP